MKIATVSLNYYTQNSEGACHTAASRTHAKNVDFVGFTEVRSAAMTEGLTKGLGDKYDLIAHQESPQAFKSKKWRLTGHRVVEGTPGEAGITPNLFLVIGTYENIKKPRKVLEIISTHTVPLTEKGHKRSDYVHRLQMWNKHWKLLKDAIQAAKAKNHTVFVIGDFNNILVGKNKIHELDPKAKWIIRNGLDWVFVIEGSIKVKVAGLTHKFDSGSDHKACWRNVVLI